MTDKIEERAREYARESEDQFMDLNTTFEDDLSVAFKAGYLAGAAEQREEWRPVSEIPPDIGNYIGYDAGHGACTAFFDGVKWEDCFGFHAAPITHWMLLPAPPKSAIRGDQS